MTIRDRAMAYLFTFVMHYYEERLKRLGAIVHAGIADRTQFCHVDQFDDYCHLVEDPQRINEALLQGDLLMAEEVADRYEAEEQAGSSFVEPTDPWWDLAPDLTPTWNKQPCKIFSRFS